MPWSMRTEGGQVLVVRQRDKKVVGRHKDRKRALAQLRVLSSLEKAQFASRSEAGRYAANQRWKNQTPKQKLDALGSKELKIVEIRGDETFKKKDGTTTRRATLTVLDDNGKEFFVDVTSKGEKGAQFIEVEAKRGNRRIGYLWASTDYSGEYGRKGKVAIGQVDVVASERRKGVATALMRLGKRYNIGSEPIYHSTILTTAGAAFARDTEIEKASFGGDRSAAGRYAADMRWQGNVKEDISQKFAIGFEPRGYKNDSGTVWATDKKTGKVIGALSFDANFIGRIYVLADYRRKGVGSLLYKEAKKLNGGLEMKADDYTVSGAGFMSAVTGEEVYQTGDNSWAGIEWKSWLERLDRDAMVGKSLIDLLKASFGGDRSAAGRYAAEQRWKGNRKKDKPKGVKSLKSAIVDALPMAMKLKSKPWGAKDESHYEMMVEMGHSEKSAKLATSETITLGDYGDPAVAAGNCGIASVDVAVFLMIAGVAKEGEVFLREVGEPSYGGEGGTHFVTQVGPKDSEDAIIVDFTLRQFEPKADFPWVGTVKEYRETGYETDELIGPEMGEEMDLIDAQGQVAYPWLDPNFAGDTDSK